MKKFLAILTIAFLAITTTTINAAIWPFKGKTAKTAKAVKVQNMPVSDQSSVVYATNIANVATGGFQVYVTKTEFLGARKNPSGIEISLKNTSAVTNWFVAEQQVAWASEPTAVDWANAPGSMPKFTPAPMPEIPRQSDYQTVRVAYVMQQPSWYYPRYYGWNYVYRGGNSYYGGRHYTGIYHSGGRGYTGGFYTGVGFHSGRNFHGNHFGGGVSFTGRSFGGQVYR